MQNLSEIMAPHRTVCQLPAVSKKRLFETIADIVCVQGSNLNYNNVLDKLVAREALGSTGLGQGIAIPHCRVDCDAPIGTLLTLTEPLDYDAPDDQPVDILFVLLVPEEAHQAHLDILAEVARTFSDQPFCEQLRDAQSDQVLYQLATGS